MPGKRQDHYGNDHNLYLNKSGSRIQTNIQKCVIWCEKFKVPHNKFSEKVNIFLPLKVENINTEENVNTEENEEV